MKYCKALGLSLNFPVNFLKFILSYFYIFFTLFYLYMIRNKHVFIQKVNLL